MTNRPIPSFWNTGSTTWVESGDHAPGNQQANA